jgi:FkbM family methyltransferase
MGFLKQIRVAANRILAPAGFELVRRQEGVMERAIARLPQLGFRFGSVIDIGAAAGTWTEMAAPILSEATFLMVEALREREPLLQQQARAGTSRLKYQICAAGPKRGKTSFVVTLDLDGSGAASGGGTTAGQLREVDMLTVDELVATHQLAAPHFLKFDTHGFELPILEGATETLKRTEVIVMECYLIEGADRQLLFWQMCERMQQFGFRCFDIVDQLYRPRDCRLWQVDLFFARSDSPRFKDLGYA